MAVKLPYPKIVFEKVERILKRATDLHPVLPDPRYKKRMRDLNFRPREAEIMERTGMGLGYLMGIVAGDYLEPSGRVLKNLGIELYVKDLETGEMEKVEYYGRCEVDHSDPARPQKIYEE